MARIFSTMSPLWTLLPERTPKQLIDRQQREYRDRDEAVGEAECVSSPK